jgi:hypothetical protein
MSPIRRLSVGALGQESTRGRLRSKNNKKKMNLIVRLSVGAVGQGPTMGRLQAKKKKKDEPTWAIIELAHQSRHGVWLALSGLLGPLPFFFFFFCLKTYWMGSDLVNASTL